MDFGGFIIVGLLGIAFVFFVSLALLMRLKYRKFSKPVIITASVCLILFLVSGSWIFYIYFLNEPLAIAAGEGDTSRVAFLLKLGGSPNAEGPDATYTALTGAAESGRTDVVKLLLQKGADPLLRDGEGRTPVERARRNEHFEIVRLIEEAQRRREGRPSAQNNNH
jgi:hypothetical protein